MQVTMGGKLAKIKLSIALFEPVEMSLFLITDELFYH